MSTSPRPVTAIRDYACGKFRRLLDSYLAGELSVETNHEILEHLERCDACRQESEAREAVRAAVRRVVGRDAQEPRAGFEAEVRALLARTPPQRASRFSPVYLLAAALFGAAVLAVAARRGVFDSRPRTVAPAAAVDAAAFHVATGTQRLCAEELTWPDGPPSLSSLEARLGAAFAPALEAARSRLSGYQLMAAHRCAHGGREVVHLVLRKEGEPSRRGVVSVIALAKTDGSLPATRGLVLEHLRRDSDGTAIALSGSRQQGFDVVSAETETTLLFVVSTRGESESLEVGRAILPALLTAFAR